MNSPDILKEILGFDPETKEPYYPEFDPNLRSDITQYPPDIHKCLKMKPFRGDREVLKAWEADSNTGLWFVIEKNPNGGEDSIRRNYYQRKHYGNSSTSFELLDSLWFGPGNGLTRIINPTGSIIYGSTTELWLKKDNNKSKFTFDKKGRFNSFMFFRPELDFAEVAITIENNEPKFKHGPAWNCQYEIDSHGLSIVRLYDGAPVDKFTICDDQEYQRRGVDTVDPDILDDPIKAPPYLDITWRTLNLNEDLGVKWERGIAA